MKMFCNIVSRTILVHRTTLWIFQTNSSVLVCSWPELAGKKKTKKQQNNSKNNGIQVVFIGLAFILFFSSCCCCSCFHTLYNCICCSIVFRILFFFFFVCFQLFWILHCCISLRSAICLFHLPEYVVNLICYKWIF